MGFHNNEKGREDPISSELSFDFKTKFSNSQLDIMLFFPSFLQNTY